MTVHSGLLRMDTPGGGHIVDITPGVESVLRTAQVERGLVSVFATGSTVAITTMEYEPGGVDDLQALLDRLIPPTGDYEHNVRNRDTNAHAHLRAAVIGPSETIPVVEGQLALGTWQQIVLIDFDDRARRRTVTSRSCRSSASARAPEPPPDLTRSERRLVTERRSCASDF